MKNLSARHGMLHYELFIRESLEAPQTMQAIAIALECIPELDDKAELLKRPHTLDTEHRDIKLMLSW